MLCSAYFRTVTTTNILFCKCISSHYVSGFLIHVHLLTGGRGVQTDGRLVRAASRVDQRHFLGRLLVDLLVNGLFTDQVVRQTDAPVALEVTDT